MTAYGRRAIDASLDALFAELPALSIEGPRGVGKTTTARRRARTFLALDDPPVAELLSGDPKLVRSYEPPAVIDEWQLFPAVFDAVRRAVDDDRSAGRFLITGSASPRRPPTHSGAGRIVTLRMRPLSLAERWDAPLFTQPTVSLAELLTGTRPEIAGRTEATIADYLEETAAGGLPGLRGLAAGTRADALAGYIDRLIDRDVPEAGHGVRNPGALRRWLTAYGAATATTASYERIRDAATAGHADKPSRSATVPYTDALERLFIIDPLPGWHPTRNPLARLNSGPKHHLADPALAVALLGLDVGSLLRGERPEVRTRLAPTMAGALFESLVALSLRVYAQAARARVHHLRTRGGDHEIDFIVSARDGRVAAFEAKLSGSVDDQDVRHLRWLGHEIGDDLLDAAVITTGPQAYRRRDGIAVIPAALLGP